MVRFEGYERRIAQIEKCLAEYGFKSLEEVKDFCTSKGIDVDSIVRGIQPIAFENAVTKAANMDLSLYQAEGVAAVRKAIEDAEEVLDDSK